MFETLNERCKRLTVVDIGLIKWTVFVAAIIIVKLFPRLLTIDYTVLAVLLVVFAARPMYVFWIKK